MSKFKVREMFCSFRATTSRRQKEKRRGKRLERELPRTAPLFDRDLMSTTVLTTIDKYLRFHVDAVLDMIKSV